MRIFLAIAMVLGLAQGAQAQEKAIETVIWNQMQAFQQDDITEAFGFASDGIKGIFGTPERFGDMVRRGYPMVHRPGEVRFLELREVAGSLWQKVLVRDQSGVLHVLDYQMIQTSDGWRIGGVQLLKDAGVGA